MKEERCISCRKAMAVEVLEDDEVQTPAGVIAIKQHRVMRCPACGEAFYTGEQAREREEMVRAAKQQLPRLVTPDAIKAIRAKVGLSQRQMGEALGLGGATFARWESGAETPSMAASGLLRLIEKEPAGVAYLCSLAGREMPVKAKRGPKAKSAGVIP